MSTIIKATHRTVSQASEAIELARLVDQVEAEDDWLRGETARLIAEAKHEAEQIRQNAVEDGRREGETAARRDVLSEEDLRWNRLESAISEAVAQIEQSRQAWLGHWEKASVRVAVAIAERLLRCKLPEHPEAPMELVREALELAAGNDEVRVCLHPDDREVLGERVELLARQLGGLGTVDVIADETVSPGGCRVETRFGVIDQRFEAQLARIEEELL
jgi:flagellar assembly protein FliH